jgi:hypothetical protein
MSYFYILWIGTKCSLLYHVNKIECFDFSFVFDFFNNEFENLLQNLLQDFYERFLWYTIVTNVICSLAFHFIFFLFLFDFFNNEFENLFIKLVEKPAYREMSRIPVYECFLYRYYYYNIIHASHPNTCIRILLYFREPCYKTLL